MPSDSRTRSPLLAGKGLTDLRDVSWLLFVVECAELQVSLSLMCYAKKNVLEIYVCELHLSFFCAFV